MIHHHHRYFRKQFERRRKIAVREAEIALARHERAIVEGRVGRPQTELEKS